MHNVQKFSYHCHTKFSDGRSSIRDMIQQAKNVGFTELGISDHLIVHKNMFQCECWKYMENDRASNVYNNSFKSILPDFQKHCDNIRRIAKEENFKVYVGFEVDYFTYDGWLEELKEFVCRLDIDYLHSGNHFFFDENCDNIINMNFANNMVKDKSLMREYIVRHFDTMRQCVESKIFSFLAHMDYLKRFCSDIYQPSKFWNEKNTVLRALQQTNTALEVSTKGLRRVNDFYPDAMLIEAAASSGIPVVISDDAHDVSEVGADFDKAEQVLAEYKIVNRFKI